jgi:3-dehydroquinate synthase
LDEIRLLKGRRQRRYSEADVTVHTDALDVYGVVESIVGQLRGTDRSRRAPSEDLDSDVAYRVETETASYSIVVGIGALGSIGRRARGLGFSGTAHIVVDGAIESSYGQAVGASLDGAGLRSRTFILPPGEGSKTVEKAGEIYEWLATGKTERRDILVAIGGGVAGDLGGFVAATYARGLPFIQVPTTVLAMADASIGGKVAVDLPAGKNLVGAFYQPSLVIADISALKTLPGRDRVAGWAEVVKTGLIADEDLVSFLESNAVRLMGGDEALMRHALARCAAIKGRVVSLDERETTGLRATLNYGHTLGHAIETVAGFGGVLHGEAVAMGMSFAGRLAVEVGRLSEEGLSRQQALIAAFGLPSRPPEGVDIDAIRTTMALDKKVEDGRSRWVLLDRIGHAQLRGDVDQSVADGVLEQFFSTE